MAPAARLDVALRESGGGRRAVVLTVRGATLQLDLVQHEAGDGAPFTLHRTGLDHLAFRVADRPEPLDGWAARLDALGVGHSGAIDIPLGAILSTGTPTASRSRSSGSGRTA